MADNSYESKWKQFLEREGKEDDGDVDSSGGAMRSLQNTFTMIQVITMILRYEYVNEFISVKYAQLAGGRRLETIKVEHPEIANFSNEELQAIPTVTKAKTMLIKEHNDVPSLQEETSLLGTIKDLRKHIGTILFIMKIFQNFFMVGL